LPPWLSNAYPLITRRHILAEFGIDPEFVAECVGFVHSLFLARRRGEIDHEGWMASQASEGARLATGSTTVNSRMPK
jgi:hypothetical protein